MGKFSRALDWAADHVGDVYFVALAGVVAVAAAVAAWAVLQSL